MDFGFYFSVFGAWFVLLVIAILNAGLREKFFRKYFDELNSHQLSSLVFIVLVFVVTYFWMKTENFVLTDFEAFYVGFLWFILTICFEFIAGHYIFGNSWKKLLNDYNVFKGRLWVFVLIFILIAPFLISVFNIT